MTWWSGRSQRIERECDELLADYAQLADVDPVTSKDAGVYVTELHPHYYWKSWAGGGLLLLGAGVMTWGIVWIAVDGNSSGGACADPSAMNCNPVYNTRTPG